MYWDVGLFFFVKQKTAYEVRIRDWSSDVCSSDLAGDSAGFFAAAVGAVAPAAELEERGAGLRLFRRGAGAVARAGTSSGMVRRAGEMGACDGGRSEEHTSELQSLMRISYAVFCLKKKKKKNKQHTSKRTSK